jgi:hypothetical protein
MRLKSILITAIALLLATEIQAQKKASNKEYKNNPVWIQMMNDTTANYFETIKAFRVFFKERPLPKEPNEVEGEDAFEKEVGLEENKGKKKSKKELKREAKKFNPNQPDYSPEVRAFRGWFYGIKPWVRNDGSIIGPKERQAIIDQQQKELKAIEKANGKN